jgi:Zn-dependent M28 family amino/carboxypeptidase
LVIHRETGSTGWLNDRVFATARRLGYSRYFLDSPSAVDDDHIPFVNAGVAAVDLIDFNPSDGYWHTERDTVEHCSPLSLTIVGRVVVDSLADLDKSPRTN